MQSTWTHHRFSAYSDSTRNLAWLTETLSWVRAHEHSDDNLEAEHKTRRHITGPATARTCASSRYSRTHSLAHADRYSDSCSPIHTVENSRPLLKPSPPLQSMNDPTISCLYQYSDRRPAASAKERQASAHEPHADGWVVRQLHYPPRPTGLTAALIPVPSSPSRLPCSSPVTSTHAPLRSPVAKGPHHERHQSGSASPAPLSTDLYTSCSPHPYRRKLKAHTVLYRGVCRHVPASLATTEPTGAPLSPTRQSRAAA